MSAQNLAPTELMPHQTRKIGAEASSEHAEAQRSLYQRGKETVVQAEQKFETYVSAHPIRSVLVAAGVGLAVGLLVGRRR